VVNISLSSVFAFLRNAGSLASIIIGAAGTGGLPPAVRAVLVAIGGILQGIEHYNSGQTPAPAPSAQAAPAAPRGVVGPAVPIGASAAGAPPPQG
jgi:hypothetical protein